MKRLGAGVVALSGETFSAAIDDHPFAVVAFQAPSWAACRAFAHVLAAGAARHPDLLFATVDVERERALREHFKVASCPTVMVFRENIVACVRAGPMRAGELDDMLRAVRSLDMDQLRGQVARPSVETCLRPAVRTALAEAGPVLAVGELVVIRDAFDAEIAERVFKSLDDCTAWRVHAGQEGDFHYHHHNLYRAEDYPADMAWCAKLFDAPGSRAWAGRLSGRDCTGPTEVSASWYLPGDHSLPHNDIADTGGGDSRQVAFVWHLAREWQPQWGGALYWCSKGVYLPAAFNTLFLFNVGPASDHFVTHVSPHARGKRLAVNGWWTGPARAGGAARIAPERIGSGEAGIDMLR